MFLILRKNYIEGISEKGLRALETGLANNEGLKEFS
jgi:hypothetical protein